MKEVTAFLFCSMTSMPAVCSARAAGTMPGSWGGLRPAGFVRRDHAAVSPPARVDALIERCYSGLDAVALRREVAALLKTLAGVDAAFVATVDPATLLFTSAISEEPLLESAAAFVANELDGVMSTGSPNLPLGRTRSGHWIRPPTMTGTARQACGHHAAAGLGRRTAGSAADPAGLLGSDMPAPAIRGHWFLSTRP
jgi:hypothetical protein